MRVLAALLLLALLAPLAGAQTTASPIKGAYHEVYVVAGRAIDSEGKPFAGGRLLVEADGAKPLLTTANCKGDFITDFPLLAPRGNVKVTAIAGEGGVNGTTTVPLDPFWRRSDAIVTLGSRWDSTCTTQQDVWLVSASLSVRLLNRTAPYKVGENEFQARPYVGLVQLRFDPPDGSREICPPAPNAPAGYCEQLAVDPRGDLRYTFTLDRPFVAGGQIRIILANGSQVSVPVAPDSRLALQYFEMTGQGIPERPREAPGVSPLALVGLAALAALGARSLLQRRRG